MTWLTEGRVSAAILVVVSVVQPLMLVSMVSSMPIMLVPRASKVLTIDRPTNKRIAVRGQRTHMVGKEAIMSAPGPMSVDRDALELIMKVALAAKPWRIDPSLTAKEWTPYKFTKPLKIAVQWWDGVVQPHPPMTRALKEVSEACRKAGMEVIDWNCEDLNHKKGWEILSSLYWPDGGKQVLDLMKESGEPILPLTKFIIQDQPSVKNLTQQELWDVSLFFLQTSSH